MLIYMLDTIRFTDLAGGRWKAKHDPLSERRLYRDRNYSIRATLARQLIAAGEAVKAVDGMHYDSRLYAPVYNAA